MVLAVVVIASTGPTAIAWVAFGTAAIGPMAFSIVVVDTVASGIVVEEEASYRVLTVTVPFVGIAKEGATSNITVMLSIATTRVFAVVASFEVISTVLAAVKTVAAMASRSFVVVKTAAAAFQGNQVATPAAEALPGLHRLGVD